MSVILFIAFFTVYSALIHNPNNQAEVVSDFDRQLIKEQIKEDQDFAFSDVQSVDEDDYEVENFDIGDLLDVSEESWADNTLIPNTPNFESLGIRELRLMVRELGVKNFGRMNKSTCLSYLQ